MSETTQRQRLSLTIDGRTLVAAEGEYVLQVARKAGIEIPTLCDHPALEPAGGCRLCLVEVTHADWKGWSELMTACLYPVAEGIQVSTRSPKVIEARRQVLTLLAARCPNSPEISALAARYDVSTDGLFVDPGADNCFLCGLCTRICDTYVTSAITTWGRGTGKAIGSFAMQPPIDCVGCGSCALICPTGNIPAERTATGYEIWGRTFDTAMAGVDAERCLGCGACEEACPFDVARVVVKAGGRRVATIPREHCRGCGACVGACPSGAIDQEAYEGRRLLAALAAPRVSVMSCPRANLGRAELPDEVGLIDVPCTGRVSSTLLLGGLAGGARGVLVMGRHQESCRLNGAEDPAADRVRRTRDVLTMVGLDADRARFVVPEPGAKGPGKAAAEYAETIRALGEPTLGVPAPAELYQGEGLDSDLALLSWFSAHRELEPDGSAWLEKHDLPAPRPGGVLLFPGELPHIDVLADQLLIPLSIPDVLRAALTTLEVLGVKGTGVQVAGCGPLQPHHAVLFQGASAVYTLDSGGAKALSTIGVEAVPIARLIRERAADRPRPVQAAPVACDGSAEATAMIEALGHRPVDLGADPLPSGFHLTPAQREAAERYLAAAEAAGARALLVSDPHALVRWALVTRLGTWRSSRVRPVIAPQLVSLAASGKALSVREIERAPRLEPATVGGRS